jgi:hypothetical protein
MKIKIAKTAYVAYLYADRHLLILHREAHSKAGEVEWAEVWECIDADCGFKGRIVFHAPYQDRRLALACQAKRVGCGFPSLDKGSENTKRHGIPVGYFLLDFADGSNLYWNYLPDLISDGLTYQPDTVEEFNPEAAHWGRVRIARIYGLPKPLESQKECAA